MAPLGGDKVIGVVYWHLVGLFVIVLLVVAVAELNLLGQIKITG